MGELFPLFGVVPPGLEAPCAAELEAAGAEEVRVGPGGVACEADLAALFSIHLTSRVASRVLLRVAQGAPQRARALAKEVPWDRFVPPRAAFHVEVAGGGSRPRELERAFSDAIRRTVPGSSPGEGDQAQLVLLRVASGQLLVSVDATGALLHRRGYRQETGAAPLRENLAAGILALAGFDGTRPLVDPMCGSGTFAIEAALWAMRRPPGFMRRFACEAWPCFPTDQAEAIRAARRAEERAPAIPLVGSDRNAGALGVARRNAQRAGVLGHIAFLRQDVGDSTPPAGAAPGLVVCNPPYGKRVGEDRALPDLYRRLGELLRARYRGWTAAILVADRALEEELGLPAPRALPLQNGGLRCRLLIAQL